MTGQEGDRSQSNLGSVGSRHSRPLGGFKPVPRGERRTGRHGSMLSRQRSRLRVWHESREWCSTRNGSRSTKWECDRRQIRNRAKVVVPTDARLDSGHRAIVVRCETRSRWLARQPGENGSRQRRISNQSVVSLRVRVEFGREAQCAVNNPRPCRGNRARPNGAAVPPATTAVEAKAKDANDRWEGPSRRQVWRQRCSLLEFEPVRCTVPSTFGGEGQHHQDSGDASQKM